MGHLRLRTQSQQQLLPRFHPDHTVEFQSRGKSKSLKETLKPNRKSSSKRIKHISYYQKIVLDECIHDT